MNNPPLTLKTGYTNYWGNLPGASRAMHFVELAKQHAEQHQAPIIIVCSQTGDIHRYEQEIALFNVASPGRTKLPVLSFPDWETLPYDYFSAHETIISERLYALYNIPRMTGGIIIASLNSIAMRLSPKSFIEGNVLSFKVGDRVDLTTARGQFEAAGYNYVNKVMEHGEFSVRGALLDLFPMGAAQPIRIDFFDDEIESIRCFDTDSQLSQGELEHFELLPAHEFPTDQEAIKHFRQKFRSIFDVELADCPIYQDVSNGLLPAGIEYYLSLFNQSTATLFDYLPPSSIIITDAERLNKQQQLWQDTAERYEERRWDRSRPILSPNELQLAPEEMNSLFKSQWQLVIDDDKASADNLFTYKVPTELQINHKLDDPLSALRQFQLSFKLPILIGAESAGRREAIIELFQRFKFEFSQLDSWQEIKQYDSDIFITVAAIEQSFCSDQFCFL
ncbi:MAG: transcription-repair coupling factor, partial [Kangiellaceae bacterium]|nr:transcription-repair coupling factor [Kangiellaceae bacterium]